MNKENLVIHIRDSINSSKNCISTNCNSLKKFWVMKKMEKEDQGCGIKLGTKCSNCMFILLNLFYLIIALLMLIAGGTGQFAYLFYDLKFEYKLVSIAFIVSGAALLFVSVVGIIGACKNSVAWTNIYGVLMMLAFVIQLSAAIVGFTCISKSESIARHTLDRLIYSSSFFEPSAATMDFIQNSLHCCGTDGPSDWGSNWKYNPIDYSNNYYYARTSTSTDISPSTRTPPSCCASGSGYRNLKCENYIQKGCLNKMYEITLQIILTIDSVALAIAVVQIVGILSAFLVAKMIRRMKTYERIMTDKCKLSFRCVEGIKEPIVDITSAQPHLNNYVDQSVNTNTIHFKYLPFDNDANEPTDDQTSDNTQIDDNGQQQRQ